LVAEQKDFIWASLLSIQGVIALGFTFWWPQLYSSPSDRVIGKVNGQPVLSSQMEDQLAIALQPYDEMRYETEKAWLDDKINQSVLSIEARREGLSPQELIAHQVGLPPSGNDTTWQAKKEAYLLGLRARYGAVSYLTPPIPKVIPIDLRDTIFEGNPNAPVKIVVFSDHECPFCQIMAPVLSDFYRSHASDIALGYWPFPLKAHKQARLAAIAAYSAAQQGRFWDYNGLLYAEPILNDATYLRLAKKINLDPVAFETCRSSSAAANYIEDHYQRASSMGINGIPTIFINGRMVGGMLTKADLEDLYQNEMRAQKK
jgi:protein-disulfide isomerase